jgi:hypothetical protein
MFDLEKAITEWRNQMSRAGLSSAKVLNELETHLREDIERHTRDGLVPQQAFIRSIMRLGHVDALRLEFEKARTVSTALDTARLATALVLVAAIVWLSGLTFGEAGFSFGEWFTASSAVVTCLLIAGFWSRAVRFLPVIHHKRKRYSIEIALFASGFICSNLFCALVLPYFERNLDGRILPAILLWAVFPIAVFIALAAGIEEAVRETISANRPATS